MRKRVKLWKAAATCGLILAAQVAAAELAVHRSSVTGRASFVTSKDRSAIALVSAGRQPAEPVAFLQEHGSLFGLSDPARELRQTKTHVDWLGHRLTTFEQIHAGVPVYSGVLKVHQNAAGAFLAANGRFYQIPAKLRTQPTLTAESAARAAILHVLAPAANVEHSELVVVDPGWYGDPPLGAHLAYYLIVTDSSVPIHEAFFVDAHDGRILDQWSVLHTALFRVVFDASAGELPGTPRRSEGEPAASEPEVNRVYDYAGDTYAYYLRAFGRDSINDAGLAMRTSVRFAWSRCPNAFWNGSGAVFCDGVAADDIVAHELTHGVTQYTAGLIYQNQSGQLNESFSDVFGELVDLFNGNEAFLDDNGSVMWPRTDSGGGLDGPNRPRSGLCTSRPEYADGVRWLVGEDATGFDDAIRDMWNPPCHNHPDRGNSLWQRCQVSDSGGVHTGSGVVNHAFAIVTDGKTFNGITVAGIGPIKSGSVWYRALATYLTPSSDFQDAYLAFNQAAHDLVGTYANDPRTGLPSDDMFTPQDAEQVALALRAVEMDSRGRCGRTVPVVDSTPPTECSRQASVFADDVEAGPKGWTVEHEAPSGPPTPYEWRQTTEPLPFGRAGVAWFCPDPDIGDCAEMDESAVHSLISPPILLPDELDFPTLAFTHFLGTEPGYDGGNVRISVNRGPWQLIGPLAFYHNRYNLQALVTAEAENTNPLAGQPAFSGVGGQWGTSLASLHELVEGGDTIHLRFDLGKDGCTGVDGWYVDDVAVYDCVAATDCNANGRPDELEAADGGHERPVVRYPHLLSGRVISDAHDNGLGVRSRAQGLVLYDAQSFDTIRIWGEYYPNGLPGGDRFTVIVYTARDGLPDQAIFRQEDVPAVRILTGESNQGVPVWEFTLRFKFLLHLPAGNYFLEIFNNTADTPDTFLWEAADYGGAPGFTSSQSAPGLGWVRGSNFNLSIEIPGRVTDTDCDRDGLPDECATDCNGNGLPDPCDLADGHSMDVNGNGLPDECSCDARMYGDLSPPTGDGSVDIADILCVLDGFRSPHACAGADLFPCGGNGLITAADLLAVIDAYSGRDHCCGR